MHSCFQKKKIIIKFEKPKSYATAINLHAISESKKYEIVFEVLQKPEK